MTSSATPAIDEALIERLYAAARAERWALPRQVFGAALAASVAHAFEGRPHGAADVERYATALHVEDLALACACAAGHEGAWEEFVAVYRPVLHRAAAAIDPTGNAQDLADSLYADLYGMGDREGSRRSLFRYFHGRSKLGTWLRAVLAQRHIDRVRATRKLDPLPEDPASVPALTVDRAAEPERARFETAMQAALASAIAGLPSRDRLRLSCYYVQSMTLAAIGRALKEHEATVSRHLTRTRAAIRDAVWTRLRTDHGMDDGAIEECFRSVSADAGALDVTGLIGPVAVRKNAAFDRSSR
ncbi:MAG TPA: sigma-70 family RNA polymerase sigma factor [Vicinamibacterales bacterium]|nr:sigma-70 family RNA polymerase sigma factor [Vicinamibacterales bacterium]